MNYSNLSNEDLNKMINNILSGNDINQSTGYVDEKQQAFISSLQSMVEDKDRALRNYRNLG